jgi:UDP-glucose 4-epimerase
MQVIDTVTRITGKPVPHTIVPRRPGDAPKLVAANNKATQVLGWTPQHSDLNTIITHAHNWRLTHSNGYPTN